MNNNMHNNMHIVNEYNIVIMHIVIHYYAYC